MIPLGLSAAELIFWPVDILNALPNAALF